MRNVFRALKEERTKPALQLVMASQSVEPEEFISSRVGLTAADAAAALGCDPHKTMRELWLEKTQGKGARPAVPAGAMNLATAESGETNSPSYWATLLEPLIAAVYTRRTGNHLRRINHVRNRADQPWMLANLGWEVVGMPGVQIFESVSVGREDLPLWSEGFPMHLRLSVMHLLAVTGKQAADIAVLLGGLELRIFRIERDDAAIARLVRLEVAFWRHVERGEAPPPEDRQMTLELETSPAEPVLPCASNVPRARGTPRLVG